MGEPWQCDDTELLDTVRQIQDELNTLYGRQLRCIGEILARNLAGATGYANPSALLQDQLRIGRTEATRRIAHADAIAPVPAIGGPPGPAPMPATADAVRAGAIGAEHVEMIRRTMVALPADTDPVERELAEKTLVDAAYELGPAAIAKLGRAIQDRLDQDGRPPTEAELQQPVNELRWITRRNGDLQFTGRLCPEGATLLTTVLSPLAKPRPADQGIPDLRSVAERDDDALLEALQLIANSGRLPTEAGERPNLVVTISLDALQTSLGTATLGNTTLIDARQARRLACDSHLIPTVLGTQSEPLDLGRKARTVTTAIRRALTLRDGGCAFPGCTIPAPWTDAHHIRHWANAA